MKTFLGNVLYLSVADALSKALNFVAQIYLARRLGVEGFGQVNLALALVAYFTLITDLNLTTVGTRDVAKSKDALAYASSFIALRLLLGVLAFVLLLVFVLFLERPPAMKWLIVLFGLSLFPSAALLEWFFNGIEKMEYLGISRVIRAVVFLALLLSAMLRGRLAVHEVALSYLASWLSSIILQGYWLRKNDWTLRFSYNPEHWRQLFRAVAPLALSVVTAQIVSSLDTVLLGFMKGDTAVGWYSAGSRIVATILGSAAAFINTLYPVMARSSGSPADLRRLLFSSSRLLLFFSFPIAVGGTVLAAPVLTVLYGADYGAGAAAFQTMIWRVVVVYATLPFSYCLLACDKGKEYFYSVAAAAVLSPLLNVVLIGRYGPAGAAAATLASESVLLVMCVAWTRTIVSVPLWGLLARPLFASVVMGLAVFLVPAHVSLRITLGVVIYLSIVFSLKWITKEDARVLR